MYWTGKAGLKEWVEINKRKEMRGKKSKLRHPIAKAQRRETWGGAIRRPTWLNLRWGVQYLEEWGPRGDGGFEVRTRRRRHLIAK